MPRRTGKLRERLNPPPIIVASCGFLWQRSRFIFSSRHRSTKCLDPFTGSYASDSTFGVMHSYLCQTETPAFDLPHHGIFHMMSHSVSCGAFVRDFHSGSSETLLRDLFLLLLMIAIAVGWWFLVRRVQEKGDTIVAGWFVKIPRPGAQPRLKQQDVNAVPIQCKVCTVLAFQTNTSTFPHFS